MTQAVVDGVSEVAVESATRRPGLAVSVTVGRLARDAEGALVRVRVEGAYGPFRVYVYADGELVEAWIPANESNEFVCGALGSGRHTLTARAVDALGRWGGDSMLYGATLQSAPRPAATSRDRGLRCTVTAPEGV